MNFCGQCGRALERDARFCGVCGAPVESPLPTAAAVSRKPGERSDVGAPLIEVEQTDPAPPTTATPPMDSSPKRQWRRMVIAAVVAVLTAAGIAVAFVVLSGDDERSTATTTTESASEPSTEPTMEGAPTASGPSTSSPGGSTSTSSTVAIITLPPTTTEAPPSADELALRQLAELVQADEGTAMSLVGRFVPQLSAKRIGLELQGVTYTADAVLQDHLLFRSGFGAILVDAGAYFFTNGGAPMDGWYLTIVPMAFDTKDDAQAWCRSAGFAPTDCFGRPFESPR